MAANLSVCPLDGTVDSSRDGGRVGNRDRQPDLSVPHQRGWFRTVCRLSESSLAARYWLLYNASVYDRYTRPRHGFPPARCFYQEPAPTMLPDKEKTDSEASVRRVSSSPDAKSESIFITTPKDGLRRQMKDRHIAMIRYGAVPLYRDSTDQSSHFSSIGGQ